MDCQSPEAMGNNGIHHAKPARAAACEAAHGIAGALETYQRVLLPVSVALSYSGSEGTTVGRGTWELELEASRPEVAVAKACTGSTIMVMAA